MTRRRVLLALVVTVLAVGCAAPWWEDVYLAVGYREVSSGEEASLRGYELRFTWLPFDEFYLPDQVCSMCQAKDCPPDQQDAPHSGSVFSGPICIESSGLQYYTTFDSGETHEIPSTFSCLCLTCYPERQ